MNLRSEYSAGKETILVVEDHTALRDMIATALRNYGFQVLAAAPGNEAMLTYEREKASIHLILTDVLIPKTSGSVISESIPPIHQEVKVLYMSGYTKNFLVHQGVLNSEANFIPKPFRVSALVKKIRHVLDTSRQERQYRA
ncbi:MAG: response regulator [Thermodesulfobacteriota bacterium]